MESQKIIEYVRQTANAELESLAPVSGGLTASGKYKVTVKGSDWMVKILPGTPTRQMWYQELNRRANEQMANPKLFKLFDDGNLVLLSPWIDGPNLEEKLIDAVPEEVGEYGRQAAVLLQQLHSEPIEYPAVIQGVQKRIHTACEQVETLGLTFPGYKECCAFLRQAVQNHTFGKFSILHKDIRPENFIVRDGKLHLIDFDNGGLGELAEDFSYLMTMGRIEHRPFAYELTRCYLEHTDAEKFWQDNLLYSTLQMVEYAIWKWYRKGRQVYFQAQTLLDQHDGFTDNIPKWRNL